MATRPARHAVLITPSAWDSAILFTFEEQGAASAAVNAINERSDGSAEYVGAVYETPMIVSRVEGALWAPSNVHEAMRINFERALPGRRFLSLRDYATATDESGEFATAIALWAFPRAQAEEVAS